MGTWTNLKVLLYCQISKMSKKADFKPVCLAHDRGARGRNKRNVISTAETACTAKPEQALALAYSPALYKVV